MSNIVIGRVGQELITAFFTPYDFRQEYIHIVLKFLLRKKKKIIIINNNKRGINVFHNA